MCKRNETIGFSLIAGGAGLLVSLLIPGAFVRVVLAVALIILGVMLLRK